MNQHAEVAYALDRLRAPIGAAESHGLLCAMSIGTARVDAGQWLGEVFGQDERVPDVSEVLELDELYRATAEAMDSDEFQFEPLLPDDEDALALRCEAVALWCRGFLYGLGISCRDANERLTEEGREVLSDISALTQVVSDPDDDGGTETDYMEIVEYLRMGVILLREELRVRPPGGGELH